ncbi:MAG: hypothetical protein ABF449_03205 [Ethanoligenens sp.]
MTTYDDKTKGIVSSDGRFILPLCKEYDDLTFKASFIVIPSIKCKGKITALFDLIVLGDVEAKEIDVKGRFVCLGKCSINGSVVVQNEIWANDLRASNIESHDRIVAQEIDGDTIIADGSIVVGKILAVEKLAKSDKNIICGETAYGAGKIAANSVITGEPIDLDNGEDAVESPNLYRPVVTQSQPTQAVSTSTEPIDLIAHGESEYAPSVDFTGYFDFLISTVYDDELKAKFARWKEVLIGAETIIQSGISKYTNIAVFIWLVEIAFSDYFKNWDAVADIFISFENHFKVLVARDKEAIGCAIDSYDKWLEALSILSRFGALIDRTVYGVAFELVVSNLGLKAKFVSERLHEKGWEAHAE